MINRIRKHIEHKLVVSDYCISMAHLLYENNQICEAFMMCVESLLALSMIPKLSNLFDDYIYQPLFLEINKKDDE